MQVVEQAADLLLMSQVCGKVRLHLLLVLVHLMHSLMRFLQISKTPTYQDGNVYIVFQHTQPEMIRWACAPF